MILFLYLVGKKGLAELLPANSADYQGFFSLFLLCLDVLYLDTVRYNCAVCANVVKEPLILSWVRPSAMCPGVIVSFEHHTSQTSCS